MKSSTSIWTVAKYAIACISFLLASVSNTKACGPDFTGWQFTWLLEHYTYNASFFPYQFDPGSQFYGRSWQEYDENANQQTDETHHNLKTWRNYLQLTNAVHDTDLKHFIYHNSSSGLRTKNNIGNNIDSKKNAAEIWQYLALMNEYKETMIPSENDWDYSAYTKVVGSDTVNSYITKCENQIKNTEDNFIQWRLLYLILRASHFNKYHQIAIQKFDKYYAQFSKDNSLAQYWCEGMYAGALLRMKQHDKAIYYSARAFANCPDQKSQAMNTYLFSNRNWKAALPFCKNANDTIYVAMLEGANHTMPNMEFIQLVYQTNASSEVLKLLWLREANKIETYLLNRNEFETKNIHYTDGELAVDMDSMYAITKTLSKFIQLSDNILNTADNIPAKVTVANTVAYYYYKTSDYAKAKNILQKIASLPKDEIESTQFKLLNTLVDLKNDGKFESKQFISLINYFKSIKYNNTNNHVGYYLLYNEIAPYYLAQKDTVAAFWTYTYANCFDADSFHLYASDYSPESFNYSNFATYLLNQHFSIEKVQQLQKDYLAKKGHSEFETYLIGKTKFDEGAKLFDLVVARKYMLAEQWEKAIQMYDALPISFTVVMGPNPANISMNDFMEEVDQKNTFSIKQILVLAQKLKSNIDNPNIANAKDKLLYASLLYNLSFYGKNHYILDNHWNQHSSNTPYYDYDSVETHLYTNNKDVYEMSMQKDYQNYFHHQNTEKYLLQALPDLESDEEKAQCTFLLAKCWQKRCPRKMKYNDEYKYLEDVSDYVGYSKKNPYFKKLSELYKKTKIQEEVFNTCSYYKMYLGKK